MPYRSVVSLIKCHVTNRFRTLHRTPMKCRIAVSVIALACPVRITSGILVFVVYDISVRGCMILALNHNPFSQYSSRRHARKTAPFVSPISTSHFNVILYELTINRSISAIAILCTLRSETILIIRIDQTQTSCKSYRFHLINILLFIASRFGQYHEIKIKARTSSRHSPYT